MLNPCAAVWHSTSSIFSFSLDGVVCPYDLPLLFVPILVATHFLKSMEETPGFLLATLQLIDTASIEDGVRLMASTFFKNVVKRNWGVRPSPFCLLRLSNA